MIEQGHTPEPWNVYDSKPNHVRICSVGEQHIYKDSIGTFSTSADAWRAILCVNALAGLNPDAVPDLVVLLKRAVAIKESVTQGQEAELSEGWLEAARAALARATGEGE